MLLYGHQLQFPSFKSNVRFFFTRTYPSDFNKPYRTLISIILLWRLFEIKTIFWRREGNISENSLLEEGETFHRHQLKSSNQSIKVAVRYIFLCGSSVGQIYFSDANLNLLRIPLSYPMRSLRYNVSQGYKWRQQRQTRTPSI